MRFAGGSDSRVSFHRGVFGGPAIRVLRCSDLNLVVVSVFDCEDVLAYGRIDYCVSGEFSFLFCLCFGCFVAWFVISVCIFYCFYVYVEIEFVVWITLVMDWVFVFWICIQNGAFSFLLGYVYMRNYSTRFELNEWLVRLWCVFGINRNDFVIKEVFLSAKLQCNSEMVN